MIGSPSNAPRAAGCPSSLRRRGGLVRTRARASWRRPPPRPGSAGRTSERRDADHDHEQRQPEVGRRLVVQAAELARDARRRRQARAAAMASGAPRSGGRSRSRRRPGRGRRSAGGPGTAPQGAGRRSDAKTAAAGTAAARIRRAPPHERRPIGRDECERDRQHRCGDRAGREQLLRGPDLEPREEPQGRRRSPAGPRRRRTRSSWSSTRNSGGAHARTRLRWIAAWDAMYGESA